MKKISLLTIAALLFASVSLIGCAPSEQDSSQDSFSKGEGWYPGTIKAGHLVALDMAPLFIAKEKGYFKEMGIDVETVFFSNPGDNNAALAGDSIQFSTNPFTLPYFGENSGVPMRIISSAGGLGIIQVVAQGELGVQTSDDLATLIKENPEKKIRIGVLQGDTLEMIVRKMLTDRDITYEQVEMVWFNDLLAMVQSFKTKDIDVLSHIKPYTTDLEVNYGAVTLTDNNTEWGHGTPNCTVAVLEDFMTKYPNTIEAYLKALNKGFEFIVRNPDEAATILDEGNYYKVDKEVLDYAFSTQPKEVVLQPNVKGMMMAIEDLASMGYIDSPKIDIVHSEFLQKNNIK